jgi:hypothetical protein
MATAGTATQTSTGSNVFEDTNGCTTFVVRCQSGAANEALVNIPGLHDSGEFFQIEKDEEQVFRLNSNGIRSVFVKGNGGNTTVAYGIISRTEPSN